MSEEEKLIPIKIEDEMKSAYIDYSMSVIVSRALPDVRDGLKPVHRRVLFGMNEMGVRSTSSYKKSARIVGDVMGKYHPHGDSSVYDTMVRMAQEWSLRYLLVDGQGNFGSVDGDSPAAMRYTEARMKKMSEDLLSDIDKETVDFQLNFDDTIMEPTVLPTRVPNLLINGASGIAVGMATNMPPHNLSEVIDGTISYIENSEIDIEELIQIIKAPDFPTGGTIYGYDGVKEAFLTGKGRVVLRGKAIIENVKDRECIIVTEIPYMVNKADMIRKTAELINDGKIEGISTLRDESDRNGMRIVYVLKRDAIPNIVLNKLYKFTQLQSSFSVNNVALVNGRPQLLNLKELIHYFVEHRHDVVVRRINYELKKAEQRAHILEGLIIASDNIDAVIDLIKKSSNPDEVEDVLLGYGNLDDCLEADGYFNSIIGRVCNRIGKSKFTLNGEEYKLYSNTSPDHLHGGKEGFNKKIWKIEDINKSEKSIKVTLTYHSKHLEENYPGNLDCTTTYELNNNNEIIISFNAITDQDTIINMTNHNYWNFHGHKNNYKDITNHIVKISSDHICETDEGSIPTGKLLDVANTKFDLNNDFEINQSFLVNGGIDHNYVLKGHSIDKVVAYIYSKITGMGVEYSTDQPGIQFYTGNMMKESYNGKHNRNYGLQYGMCLETQIFPDAINQPDFPSTILKKGETYSSNTKIKLRNDFI